MKRKHKYNAVKTVVDGITFPSKAEARRYSELKLLERGGVIQDIELQPQFICTVNGKLVCKYVADFQYAKGNNEIVEDVKGVKTPVYRLKKKLVEALYGITITEIGGK